MGSLAQATCTNVEVQLVWDAYLLSTGESKHRNATHSRPPLTPSFSPISTCLVNAVCVNWSCDGHVRECKKKRLRFGPRKWRISSFFYAARLLADAIMPKNLDFYPPRFRRWKGPAINLITRPIIQRINPFLSTLIGCQNTERAIEARVEWIPKPFSSFSALFSRL